MVTHGICQVMTDGAGPLAPLHKYESQTNTEDAGKIPCQINVNQA